VTRAEGPGRPALVRGGESIGASAGTVILALLTLPPRKPIALGTLLRVPRRQAPLLKGGEVDAIEIANHDVGAGAGGAGQHRGVVGPGDPAGLFVRPAAAGASPGAGRTANFR